MGILDLFRKPRSEKQFLLPKAARGPLRAQAALQKHYRGTTFRFPIGGTMSGSLAEAEACRVFNLTPAPRGTAGYDAKAADGRTVQIKSTAGGHGAAFSWHEVGADHLIFLDLDLEKLLATVVYNGPEKPVRRALGETAWSGTRPLRREVLVELDKGVSDRLPMIAR